MRVLSVFLAFAALVNAQYFSEGWKPGQAVSTAASSASEAAFTPRASSSPKSTTESLKELLDVSNVFKLGPVQKLFQRVGVNISERLEQVKEDQAKLWDARIPLITDDNYGELIVNETLTEQEEKDRVWFLVITVTSAKQDGVSKFVDTAFDSAYNVAQENGDLPAVRWGRIDYLNVTAITTKWAIWQAPYLVVLKDRGQSLRFFKAHQIRLTDELLYNFLKENVYELTPQWKTAYAPGGSREYILDYLALVLTKIYNVFILLPKWLVYIMTGAFGSIAIGLLHGKPKPTAASAPAASTRVQSKAKVVESSDPPKPKTEVSQAPANSNANPTAKRGGKQRKGGKK